MTSWEHAETIFFSRDFIQQRLFYFLDPWRVAADEVRDDVTFRNSGKGSERMEEKQEQQERKLLTISEVSEYLSIKQKTIYAKVEAKGIPHYKIGRLVRFRLDEIDEWLGGCRQDKKTEAGQPKTKTKRRKKSGRTNDHFSKVVAKIIDAETDKYYSTDYGKSDQSKGLRKEANNGSI